ncbi:hypothetical protein MASR1M65_25030 [Saprospiraceae bacterium]
MVSKILKVLFFNLFLFSTVVQLRAQDPVFSQFYSSPVQINPAFAGNTLNPFISLQYRNQWPALKAYVTYAATYDQAIPDLNIGTGILLMTDNAGDGIYKTNQVAGFFSYDLQLGNDIHTKIGVEAGYVQSRLNWNKLVFFDQLDLSLWHQRCSRQPKPEWRTKGRIILIKAYLIWEPVSLLTTILITQVCHTSTLLHRM